MFGSVGRQKENNIKLIKYTEKRFWDKNRITKYWKQEIHLLKKSFKVQINNFTKNLFREFMLNVTYVWMIAMDYKDQILEQRYQKF